VVAIGNPLGQTHTVSDGIVSGLHRDISIRDPEGGQILRFTNLIQTDAAINPGNSGGPLLTVNGELLGINSSMNMGAENIGFAIPVAQVRRVLEEKLLNPDYARAWLGFEASPSDFRVTNVVADGPAARAGLRVGDRVASLGASQLDSEEAWRLARLNAQPGQDLAVEFLRDGRRTRAAIKPWNRMDAQLFDRLGLRVEVEKFNPGFRELLKITQVRPDGPATSFRPGDVIEGVQASRLREPRSVSSTQDLLWVLSRLEAGDGLTLWVYRDEDGDGTFEDEPDYTERFKGRIVLR
jgi:membrane-associated protease RseP (regulator of RpoE activity)